ncbi:MAG: hypothetical protein AAFO89_12490, partial [Planctomycetota bacterium]
TRASSRLSARVKDHRKGIPVQLGEGDLDPERFVAALAEAEVDIPVVFEWDAAWFDSIAPAEEVVGEALQLLCAWSGQTESSRLSA